MSRANQRGNQNTVNQKEAKRGGNQKQKDAKKIKNQRNVSKGKGKRATELS